MKIIINLHLFLLLIASCSSAQYSQKDMQGTYSQEGNKNIKLVFKNNKFAYTDAYTSDLALYTCCDTITTGIWGIEKGLLYLSTPQLSSSIIDAYVTEKSTPGKDTLYFYLNNPIEDFYKTNNVKARDILYKVSIDAVNSNYFERSLLQEYSSNLIKVYKPRDIKIDKFYILAYPNSNFGGRNIATRELRTFEYQVKNEKSNVFEINVPQFNYAYLSYIRLNKDFVRIISKNKLEWDGHFYTKE